MGSDTEDRLGHRGVVTRRRVLASSAAVLGGAGVSSVPWRVAFAEASRVIANSAAAGRRTA